MRAITFLLLLALSISAYANSGHVVDPNYDISPAELIAFVLVGGVVLCMTGLGIFIGIMLSISAAVVALFGISITAVFYGFARQRFSAGLRLFHYLAIAVASLPIGIGAVWLVSYFASTPISTTKLLALGAFAGLGGGLLLAYLLDRLILFVLSRLSTKLSNSYA